MKLLLLLVVSSCLLVPAPCSRIYDVPEDVLSFIMGCEGRFRDGEAPTVPLAEVDVDPNTGKTKEYISMVDIPQLKQSLQDTVENDQLVSRVMAHVEDSLKARQNLEKTHKGCTNIKIDVPPQEVTGLSEQLQAVVQQNNYQLLEQVNTLFTFKLNSFYKEVEKLLTTKLTEIGEGLLQLEQNLQKVAETSTSPKEACVAAGETRIFQSDSSPSLLMEEESPLPPETMDEEVVIQDPTTSKPMPEDPTPSSEQPKPLSEPEISVPIPEVIEEPVSKPATETTSPPGPVPEVIPEQTTTPEQPEENVVLPTSRREPDVVDELPEDVPVRDESQLLPLPIRRRRPGSPSIPRRRLRKRPEFLRPVRRPVDPVPEIQDVQEEQEQGQEQEQERQEQEQEEEQQQDEQRSPTPRQTRMEELRRRRQEMLKKFGRGRSP